MSENKPIKTFATSIDDLIAALGALKPDTPMYAIRMMSYRGYYECLGVEIDQSRKTDANEVRAQLESALGDTFTGYKGGDYVMHGATRVYVAPYGETGSEVLGVLVGRDGASFLVEL